VVEVSGLWGHWDGEAVAEGLSGLQGVARVSCVGGGSRCGWVGWAGAAVAEGLGRLGEPLWEGLRGQGEPLREGWVNGGAIAEGMVGVASHCGMVGWGGEPLKKGWVGGWVGGDGRCGGRCGRVEGKGGGY
jgi:hypothetical protein